MINDVLQTTVSNIEKYRINSIDDVFNAKSAMVDFSKQMLEKILQIKDFMYNDFYHSKKITKNYKKYKKIIYKTFNLLMKNGDKLLKRDWKESYVKKENKQDKATLVFVTFIAGITDSYIQKFLKS